MNHLCEITKELFYQIKQDDTSLHTLSGSTYTDHFFIKHGVKFIRRTQSAATNYYIQDINS